MPGQRRARCPQRAASMIGSSDAEHEGLPGSERFAQLEILKRDPAGDWSFAAPVRETRVHRAIKLRNDLRSGFAPVLGNLRSSIIPKMRSTKRLNRSGVILVIHD